MKFELSDCVFWNSNSSSEAIPWDSNNSYEQGLHHEQFREFKNKCPSIISDKDFTMKIYEISIEISNRN